MGGLSLIDFIFNVCRTFTDVLHILAYILLVVVAIIIALYRYDEALYDKYVYFPILLKLYKKEQYKLVKITGHGRRSGMDKYQKIMWNGGSNRLPYFIKALKHYFKNFK